MSSIFFLISLLLITGYGGVECSVVPSSAHHNSKNLKRLYGFHPSKLFVFGDSYSDTGNIRKSISSSWKLPYGMTFPGKPAGRFSDGRVITDYLARFVGIKSPVPYRWRQFAKKNLCYGMNFAYGGTGVFDTLILEPNMTTQIDFFEKLIHESVYTKRDLASSLALVTVSGNDYAAYTAKGGSIEGLPAFITSVVNQLAFNVRRIHAMGVRKVALTSLQPLGCLPRSTRQSSFQQCNATENTLVSFHNLVLEQAMAKLINETKDSTFVILDLYSSFTTVLKNKGSYLGNLKFETPLKPCCMGISSQYSCGSIDKKGAKMYTVCSDPDSAFFWDMVHPSQAGWRAVYLALQKSLKQIYN